MPSYSGSTAAAVTSNKSGVNLPSLKPRYQPNPPSKKGMQTGRIKNSKSIHDPRISLVCAQLNKKAIKVRFYRNGDCHYEGITYAVSADRFRTFESLLAALTTSAIAEDRSTLPTGVRCIFSIDGVKRVTCIDQLEQGESYVCASNATYRNVRYPTCSLVNWQITGGTTPRGSCNNLLSLCAGARSSSVTSGLLPAQLSLARRLSVDTNTSLGSDFSTERDYIRPKIVTFVRNGRKPRKSIRMLFNRKTVHSYEQVLDDISREINKGVVKKITTLKGQKVVMIHSLRDFFGDELIFIVHGTEKEKEDDYIIREDEIRLVSAYKCRSKTPRPERITLRSAKLHSRLMPLKSAAITRTVVTDKQCLPTIKTIDKSRVTQYNTSNALKVVKPVEKDILIRSDGDEIISRISQKYIIGKVITTGRFSIIKVITDKKTKESHTLKIISKSNCYTKKQLKSLQTELSILRLIKHENIVCMIEFHETDADFYILLDTCMGVHLMDYVIARRHYTERDVHYIILCVTNAVFYLHSMNIVHRDINCSNIMIRELADGLREVKLGDFGMATIVEDSQALLFDVCGTPDYMAPEILQKSGYSKPVDMWAVGVVMFILLTGSKPFNVKTTDLNIIENILNCIFENELNTDEDIFADISDNAKEILSQTLINDASVRLTAPEMIMHRWFMQDPEEISNKYLDISENMEIIARPNTDLTLLMKCSLDHDIIFHSKRNSTISIEALANVQPEIF